MRTFASWALFCLYLTTSPVWAQGPEHLRPTEQRYRDIGAGPVGDYVRERRLVDSNYHWPYQTERQQIQDQIVERILKNGRSSDLPRIIFTAGGLAAGKSTALKAMEDAQFYDPNDFLVIDMDYIREQLPEWKQLSGLGAPDLAGDLTQKESGLIQELILLRALKQKKNILIDSTLKDLNFTRQALDYIRKSHSAYSMELVYVSASEAQLERNVIERNSRSARKISLTHAVATRQRVAGNIPQLHSYFDRRVHLVNDGDMRIETIHNSGATHHFQVPLKWSNAVPLLSLKSKPKKDPRIHLAFDLDFTLVAETNPDLVQDKSKLIEIDGIHYRVADGAESALQKWANDPRIAISFYSGGEEPRNIALLKRIRLPDGRSAYDIAHHILSRKDLVEVQYPAGTDLSLLKPWQRWRKDLSRIDPDLSRVVLFDDVEHYSLPGQESSLFWMGTHSRHYDSWEVVESVRASGAVDPDFLPPSQEAWTLERSRIQRLESIVNQVLESSAKPNFAEELQKAGQSFSRRAYPKKLAIDVSIQCLRNAIGN